MCCRQRVGTVHVDDDDFFIAAVDGHSPVVDTRVNLWMVTFGVNIIQVQFKS